MWSGNLFNLRSTEFQHLARSITPFGDLCSQFGFVHTEFEVQGAFMPRRPPGRAVTQLDVRACSDSGVPWAFEALRGDGAARE